ncbi:hypothetical protein N665_0032s0029 [Sinapis alba]|nr:hypothetical protein N665_0032s0029 [Sinapis alba]
MIFFDLGFGNICSSIGIGRLKSLKHITLEDLNVSLLDVLGCKRLLRKSSRLFFARILTWEEPFPIKSIAYHTYDSKLFSAVRDALHDDEYEEPKESRLRVFLKFKEMDFGWASRLVHYMLCFQLNIKKKYELWSLVGADQHLENPRCEVTNEITSFWERIGVSVDACPSSEQIIRALKRCQEWSRDDRMWLGYLAIFFGFIEGRKYSSATRASLARLVMDLEKFENYPWGRVAFKVLMDSSRAKDFTKSYTVDGFIQVLQTVPLSHCLGSDCPTVLDQRKGQVLTSPQCPASSPHVIQPPNGYHALCKLKLYGQPRLTSYLTYLLNPSCLDSSSFISMCHSFLHVNTPLKLDHRDWSSLETMKHSLIKTLVGKTTWDKNQAKEKE